MRQTAIKNQRISNRGGRLLLAMTIASLSASTTFEQSTAQATTTAPESSSDKAVKMMRYLKPTERKNDLNEGQDRSIKQRTFKAGQNINIHGVLNPAIGVYASVSTTELKDSEALKKLLDSDKVAGISALVSWSELEPVEGQYKWGIIEDALKICQLHGKYLILRVSTCGLDSADQAGNSDTPNFVFNAGSEALTYNGVDGKAHRMPIFWDKTYLAKWANFVKAMGDKFDKNESLHSVGITGGGILGGTLIVPDLNHTADSYRTLEQTLTNDHGMTPQKVVEHWKYVADLFPKAFEKTTLNFDIDTPLQSRGGQTMLDEISDYLVYRYGERIFITRQNIADAKHGFDLYRVIVKLKNDTYTGYALNDKVTDADFPKLVKNSLNDGVSFMEIPSKYFVDENPAVVAGFENLKDHLGYQIACQQAKIDTDIKCGEPIKASFVFANLGSSAPIRPNRQLDKDIPTSYQIGLEVKDEAGKSVVLTLVTPSVPTTHWFSGKPINCSSSFRLPEHIKPGEYSVSLALVNKETKKRIRIIDARPQSEQVTVPDSHSNTLPSLFIGKLKVS
ncbi:MAG: DUF4832 domain-containing protein [Candidatus Obscuribacterales bacterium]|nr:DUF4832 domain-containing protein [Candidatus Obscuribacterales bacterium]